MAKSTEVVTRNSPKNSIKLDEITDAESLKTAILKAPIQKLSQSPKLFDKINNLLGTQERTDILNYLLSKSSIITKEDLFKINVILNAIETIYQAYKNSHCAIKNEQYTKIITLANQGLEIYCNILTSNPLSKTIVKSINWDNLNKIVINDLAQSDFKGGFDLAKLSLTQRTKILLGSEYDSEILVSELIRKKQEHTESTPQEIDLQEEAITAFLQATNKIAELSLQSNDTKIILSGLPYAEELYNIATLFNNPEYRQQSLQHMAKIYTTAGDHNKARSLEELANNILSDNSNIIKKFGHTNPEILEIKSKIKTTHLDPVYDAASAGKWTNSQLSLRGWQDQGVGSYIRDRSENESYEDYNIKMALIFESIILSINNSEKHDPTCAIIFAQQYPKIIKYVIKHHPEYFVNTDMLHICAEKLDIKELQELTNNNKQAPSGYRSYQEKAIITFIEKRLTTDNIIQKAKELAKGAWNDDTQKQLIAQFENLDIGKNLGTISDSLDIARALLVKAVIEAVQERNSGNFAPIKEIGNKYPSLMKAIFKYHQEYLGENELILKILAEIIKQEDKVPTVTQIEEGYHNIEVEQQTQDTSSKIIGDIDSLVEWS